MDNLKISQFSEVCRNVSFPIFAGLDKWQKCTCSSFHYRLYLLLQQQWLMVFGLSIFTTYFCFILYASTRVYLAADPAEALLSNKFKSLCWHKRGDYVVGRKSSWGEGGKRGQQDLRKWQFWFVPPCSELWNIGKTKWDELIHSLKWNQQSSARQDWNHWFSCLFGICWAILVWNYTNNRKIQIPRKYLCWKIRTEY